MMEGHDLILIILATISIFGFFLWIRFSSQLEQLTRQSTETLKEIALLREQIELLAIQIRGRSKPQ